MVIIKISPELVAVYIHASLLRIFVSFLPARVFFFCRNQEATIISILPELVSVYIYVFYFLVSDFCIQDAAEPRTMTIGLLKFKNKMYIGIP